MKLGFVRVPRALLEHPLLNPERRLSPFEAYIDLLSRANWKPSQVELGGRRVTIEPGQLLCSAGSLATRWNWPRTSVQRFLDALHAGRLAGRLSHSEATVLTLYPDGDMPKSELTVSPAEATDKCSLPAAEPAAARVGERALLKKDSETAPEQISPRSSSDLAPEPASEARARGKPLPHPLFQSAAFAQFIKETMESARAPSLLGGSLMESLRSRYVQSLRDGGVWDAVLENYPELAALFPPPDD